MELRDMAPGCAQTELVRFLLDGGILSEEDRPAANAAWRRMALKGVPTVVRLRNPSTEGGPFIHALYDPNNPEHRAAMRQEITKCERVIKSNTKIKGQVMEALVA